MRILLSTLALSLATSSCSQNPAPEDATDARPKAAKDCETAQDKAACEKEKRKHADDYPGLW